MYLHIGGEYQIALRYILAIYDLDEITREDNEISLEYLANLENSNILDSVSPELPRSLIITFDRAYLSPISTHALKERIQNIYRNLNLS